MCGKAKIVLRSAIYNMVTFISFRSIPYAKKARHYCLENRTVCKVEENSLFRGGLQTVNRTKTDCKPTLFNNERERADYQAITQHSYAFPRGGSLLRNRSSVQRETL
jgi:hypothetical protein